MSASAPPRARTCSIINLDQVCSRSNTFGVMAMARCSALTSGFKRLADPSIPSEPDEKSWHCRTRQLCLSFTEGFGATSGRAHSLIAEVSNVASNGSR